MTTIQIYRLDPYPSDITDKQWEYLSTNYPDILEFDHSRRLLDALLYKFSNIVPWTSLPRDFPAPRYVESFFLASRISGLLSKIISYLASNYQLHPTIISGMRRKNIDVVIEYTEYEVQYGEGSRPF